MITNKDYIKIVTEQPWQEMEDHFEDLPKAEVKPICQLDINTYDWIKYTIDNVDQSQHKWEMAKSHYTGLANKWAEVNNIVGRNKQNTYELNYGMNGNTNEELKELLGEDNIKKLNVDPSSILIRLIVKMPGHGIAWHHDDAGSYAMKFPHLGLSGSNKRNDKGELKRLWWSIDEWRDGHAMQISKTVLTHWKAGEVFDIPFGQGHASSNFGYRPQYTVSFTGLVYD